MFSNPHKTKIRKNERKLPSDILLNQKRVLKKSFTEYLLISIMFLIMAIIVFSVGIFSDDSSHSNQIFFVALPILIFIAITYTFISIKRCFLLVKLKKISSLSEQRIEINCKKVSFLYHPISRHSFIIICIIFQDENGKKYYNILNDNIMNSFSDIERKNLKKLKEKLTNAKVSLLCYENTNFITSYQLNKTFETLNSISET
jgi:hypothetical protein